MKRASGILKSRPGAALVTALIVILVGGLLVGALFHYVSQYSFFSREERGGYVDHTTLVSYTQETKGRIVSLNIENGKVMHAPALGYYNEAAAKSGSLGREDLLVEDLPVRTELTRDGEAGQKVTVEVYDLLYQVASVDEDAMHEEDFPPSFKLTGEGENIPPTSGDTPTGGGLNIGGQGNIIGGNDDDVTTQASPEKFGAYLVRARLFGKDGKALRTAEEVFLQILD